ncbi:uncharacterized protein LOC127101139 [Lathyrus oleraceus]|uniref:uncharacterized protein LOC127101139 n=1 Tax=Pisum sativum TaxID=3888 RepID=UPI0021CF1DBC|nr:uncharacterized protein LOC127101139 [Pisum sativum]
MTHVMAQANEALLVNQEGNQNENGEDDEFQGLEKSQNNNPFTFNGRYDPDGAHAWIQEIEKIFRVMASDVSNLTEIELLKLKQGNMSMVDYAAKFEELYRYYPHYKGLDFECSKCPKFVNGMRSEIKLFIGYQEICHFSVLINTCMIPDKDTRARSI